MKDTDGQTVVLWSDQAASKRCASSSTGSFRPRDQIIIPATAPQMAPAAQRNFFICSLTPPGAWMSKNPKSFRDMRRALKPT